MSLKLVHPSTIVVAGPTQSGKTNFVVRLLEQGMLTPEPTRVIWVYREWQPLYERLRAKLKDRITFIDVLPPGLYDQLRPEDNNLVVLDDQMELLRNNADLSKLFTIGSHHRNASVIYIVQNVFDKGKATRAVSLNSHYIVLFKNPRDSAQVQQLAYQIFGHRWRFLSDAYKEETSLPYHYLLLDLRPETPDDMRVRAQILPDGQDAASVVYIPRV